MSNSLKNEYGDHSGIFYSIVTVSDRCYAGVAEDLSGSDLQKFIKEIGGIAIDYSVVPDDVNHIESKLRSLVEQDRSQVILTTGGTGFAPRDVTPEATLRIIEKRAQGLETAMTMASLQKTCFGMLSRAVCGVSKRALIINLPGSRKGAMECFEAIVKVIPHAVALIRDDIHKVKVSHGEVESKTASNGCTTPLGTCTAKMKPDDDEAQETQFKSKVNCDVTGRPRHSKYDMVEDKEALKIIVSAIDGEHKRKTEKISVKAARGRSLAKPLISSINIPACDVSTKDGYAVRSTDTSDLRTVIHHSEPASDASELRNLGENECIRVTTGAPLPPGADAVVQVEDTELVSCDLDRKEETVIKLKKLPNFGLDIRKSGSDVRIGDLVVSGGTALNSVDIARIVSVGVTEITVFKKPIVAVLSTGNEIVDAFTMKRAKKGAIFDSNRIMLISMLEKNGYPVVDIGIVPDEPSCLLEKLSLALSQADVIISSGGVSMGEKDFLKPVLEIDLGAKILFGRISMKPGKPTTFATLKWKDKTKFVFALPGNPASSLATAILFVLPALRLMEGLSCYNSKADISVVTKDSSYKLDTRPEYYRSVLRYCKSMAEVIIDGPQASSGLSEFAQATVLARLPSISEASADNYGPQHTITPNTEALCPVYFIGQYI
ncbi:unnamed protein product [Bemisia tabaci]|uniref:MoaB/Mog domain-containing protein n=1 Tax=Bemisia tabaci TaxID=7038 RepID=A0A9P0F1W5_BEMTA|nr:unnamed protein product [Bemisia tabaci]